MTVKLTPADIEELNAYLATVNEDFTDFETLDAIVEDLSPEEIEQLDELSKKTLGSYITKAATGAGPTYSRANRKYVGGHSVYSGGKAEGKLEVSKDMADHALNTAAFHTGVGDTEKGEVYSKFNKAHEKIRNTLGNRAKGIETAVKKLTKEEVEVKDVTETAAADTLHPGAAGCETKSSILAGLIQKVAGMSIEDLSKWNDQALALIGHEADKIDAATAAKNKSTVDMKKTTKEDVESLLTGDDLTEEFKEKTTTLFEAAVFNRVAILEAELQEAYEASLEEAIKDISENLSNDLEAYLNDATETFMKENAVAIETSLKNDITEDFITGLKVLFKEHYMEIPDEKVDVLAGLAEENEGFKAEIDRLVKEKNELSESLNDVLKESLIEDGIEGLTLTEAEKFKTLAESIEFSGDVESYGKKLSYIKENYFKKAPVTSNILTEEFEADENTEVTEVIDPAVSRYVQAISRTTR